MAGRPKVALEDIDKQHDVKAECLHGNIWVINVFLLSHYQPHSDTYHPYSAFSLVFTSHSVGVFHWEFPSLNRTKYLVELIRQSACNFPIYSNIKDVSALPDLGLLQ